MFSLSLLAELGKHSSFLASTHASLGGSTRKDRAVCYSLTSLTLTVLPTPESLPVVLMKKREG